MCNNWFCSLTPLERQNGICHLSRFLHFPGELYIKIKCSSIIFAGLLKHSQAIIKAYVADVTPPEERPAALGTLNSICSSGFIIGPMIGGHIAMSKFGFQGVAFITGLIFFCNSFFIFVTMPDTKEPRSSSAVPRNEILPNTEASDIGNEADDNTTVNTQKSFALSHSFAEFVTAIRQVPWVSVTDIFFVRFLASLSMIIFRSSFNLILEYRHGTSPKTNGYIMSYNAVLGVFSGFSVRWISGFFRSPEAMHRFFSVMLVIALSSLSIAPDITYVFVALAPLCVSTSVLRVASSTLLYRKGGEGEKGLLTGLSDSFMSLSRMVGPTIGGIAQDYNLYGPGIVSTSLALFAASLAFLFDLGKVGSHLKQH